MRILRTISLLSVLVVLLSACGTAATPEPVSITIDMDEFTFTPASLDLKVGQRVTLELNNNGALAHEIMFGRQVMNENNRPAGYMEDMFATGGVEPEVNIIEEGDLTTSTETHKEHEGFMVIVGAGGRATMTFDVTEGMAGEWEMGCFEQDGVHYDAGMLGTVTVSQ